MRTNFGPLFTAWPGTGGRVVCNVICEIPGASGGGGLGDTDSHFFIFSRTVSGGTQYD